MEGGILWRGIKELRHERLGEPDGLILETAFDAGFSVVGGAEDDLADGVLDFP
jgi:hypothetical protein